MARLVEAFKFPNGVVMAFDEGGNQIPEYQGYLSEVEAKIHADYPAINITPAQWSDDGIKIEPVRPFRLRRRRESVTAAEVVEHLRGDPVTVNRIEMAISQICGES